MARKHRIHFPGASYHVIARGNRHQEIFLDDRDYGLYLSLLLEYKKRYGFLLYAYILMPNHLHLLIEVNEVPLSRLMQVLQFRYSRNFNIKYGKWGHLFHGRYKAILYQKDSYLLDLSVYLHCNPVRMGLVEHPGEYPWSSYRDYVGEGQDAAMVDSDLLFMHFSDSRPLARRQYAHYVDNCLSQGHRTDFYHLKDQSFLGSEDFVNAIKTRLNKRPPRVHDVPIEEIVSKVSSVLCIPPHLFYTSSRNHQGAWGRSVAGYLARELNGLQIKTIAGHFHRDPAVISQGIGKLEEKLGNDKRISQLLSELEQVLAAPGKSRRSFIPDQRGKQKRNDPN